MVVFPRTRMTLAIAREKSVRAVEEAMMRPDRALITASQRDPDIDDPQPKDIFDTGALVEITTMHRQQDGSLQVLLSGLHRVKIEEFFDLEPFMRVTIDIPQEPQARGAQGAEDGDLAQAGGDGIVDGRHDRRRRHDRHERRDQQQHPRAAR